LAEKGISLDGETGGAPAALISGLSDCQASRDFVKSEKQFGDNFKPFLRV
jgi:hypothetical protein